MIPFKHSPETVERFKSARFTVARLAEIGGLAVGVTRDAEGYTLEIVKVRRGTFGQREGYYDEEAAAPYTQILEDGSYGRLPTQEMWVEFVHAAKEDCFDFDLGPIPSSDGINPAA